MRRLRFDSVFRFCSIVLLACLCHRAQAAELGDAAVRSYIGQPLVADVELSALADPAAQVTVRNAHADVYRGANIGLNPVLSSLAFSVVRRDGSQFVHITSTRPVESDYVHLFLELTEGNKRNIRPVTLWLTADPTPPPPPKPVPSPAPVIAKPVPAPAPASPPISRAEPEEPAPVRKPVRVITLGQAPAACAVSEEKLKSCAETDYKNGLLSAQVVELEEKVRQLQMIVDAKTLAPAAAAPLASAPKKPSVPPPPAKKTAAEPTGGFPWLLVAGLVLGLAVLAGGAWFLLKGNKAKTAEPPAADTVPWFRRLAARLRRKPKVEPEKIPPEA
jgi:hypothetical protein